MLRVMRILFGLIMATSIFSIIISSCGKEKIIIKYRDLPLSVQLIFPPNDSLIHENNPTFHWSRTAETEGYQLQVSGSSSFIGDSYYINVQTSDTAYTTVSGLPNRSFYWRVRGRNADDIWGDWSDASVWIFHKSDNVNFILLTGQINTVGTATDVYLRNDTAYVADGASDLTIVDVTNKSNPSIIENIDTISDDFAKSVYVNPLDTVPYAFVADLDGRIQVLNTFDSSPENHSGFGDQNIEDISGVFISDTLYIFAVRSGSGFNLAGLLTYQVLYYPGLPPNPGPWPWNPIDTPADAIGVFADSANVYIACDVAGLIIVDLSDIYNPYIISSLDLEGSSLKVFAKDDYVYVASDRAGLYVINAVDKANPVIATHINTSGRTKDVHVVGDYAFIADGSGGLKVVDISVPDSAYFIAAYDTPFANGIYADSNYVYICDRDEGLMIFENLVIE